MEGDNAYMCEELGKRVPAVKRTAIRVLPQMLCVHLKRFEFDYNSQTRHKLRDRCVARCAAVARQLACGSGPRVRALPPAT
jgi:ubiquitin C-terminal hydrolase